MGNASNGTRAVHGVAGESGNCQSGRERTPEHRARHVERWGGHDEPEAKRDQQRRNCRARWYLVSGSIMVVAGGEGDDEADENVVRYDREIPAGRQEYAGGGNPETDAGEHDVENRRPSAATTDSDLRGSTTWVSIRVSIPLARRVRLAVGEACRVREADADHDRLTHLPEACWYGRPGPSVHGHWFSAVQQKSGTPLHRSVERCPGNPSFRHVNSRCH